MYQQNQQLAPIQEVYNVIMSQEEAFNSVNSAPNDINFLREAEFATQILQGNEYLLKIAKGNRDSLINAIKNVSAIGVTLNPALKRAYLIPRKGAVKLDISYHGLMWLATSSGSIEWLQAEIVLQGEQYINNGAGEKPTHVFDSFSSSRLLSGDAKSKLIVGAYVIAKTHNGDYLTHTMPISEIYAIRERSESWKGGRSSPWKTDEIAMIKKTVVRQGSTFWPNVESLRKAEEYLNSQMDEGIDLNGNTHTNDVASAKDVSVINALLSETQTLWSDLIGYASRSLGMNNAQSPADLTPDEATKIISMLNQKKEAMKNARVN